MSDRTPLETTVAGAPVEPATADLRWVDRERGIARVEVDGRSELVGVEGSGTDWIVTLRGRRIAVEVRTWRERMLAEAETATHAPDGPMTVAATLPGLVVAIAVRVGDEVTAGAPLLTIEAMKMQNEVRAPRSGRVSEISVASGQAVATGVALLRLE